MTNNFLARILRPTIAFALVFVFVFAVVPTIAFAQAGSTEYTLTDTDVVCEDVALTQGCTTASGKLVTVVPFVQNPQILVVYVGGTQAGFMKAPASLPAATDTASQPVADTSQSPTSSAPKISFTGIWTDVGNRLLEVWKFGWFHALFLLVGAFAIPMFPPIENNVEQRVFLNEYYLKFVAGFAVLVFIQFLIYHGQLDWLLSWLARITKQAWIPNAAIWIIAALGLGAVYFGLQNIYNESGSSSAVNPDVEPSTERFKDQTEYESFLKSMAKEHKSALRKGYTAGNPEPYYVVVNTMMQTAKEDNSYLTSTLFLIWIVLELFGIYGIPIQTSFVGMDIFDLILLYAAYVQWGKEIFAELGQSWGMVLKTLSVGIIVGGMYLFIKTLVAIIPATSKWVFLGKLLPIEIAPLFLPLIYMLIQGKKGYVVGTTDIASGVLIGTFIAVQIFPKLILG